MTKASALAPGLSNGPAASARMPIKNLPREVTNSGWFETLGNVAIHGDLAGSAKTDWVVVGGGWFGVNAARRLAELRPQDRIVLVDAGMIGNNAAGRCAGFAIDLAHNPRNPDFALDQKGNIEERDLNLEGIAYLRDGVDRHGIHCAWSPEGKTHSAATARGVDCLKSLAGALDRIGEKYAWYDASRMREMVGSSYYIQGLHTPGTVLMQPATMLRGIIDNLGPNVVVYENTPVIEVIYGRGTHILRTQKGEIAARNIILSANGWISEFGFYPKSAIPVATYASLTRPLTEKESAAIGGRAMYGLIPAESFGTTVRRTADNRLFLRNVYDYATDFRLTTEQVERARKSHQVAFDRRYPEISAMGFEHSWGGVFSLAPNGGAVFGELGAGVYGAGFCNGTGVARGTIAGKAIAEYVSGQRNKSIEMLLSRVKPSKALPRPLTALGVYVSTRYRFWLAGREV